MKSVLVTGGSGTFGSAFIEAALAAGVERLCVYSRGEHRQAELRERWAGDERLRFFIGDVRDCPRLRRAMSGCDVVVHAAALKRIEVCEYDVMEVAKTNVIGTMNVIDAAIDAGVEQVVGLSSDKAVDPVNAYGATKMLLERLLLSANNARGAHGPRLAVVRYGNVWASSGSVVERWRKLQALGHGEVPVTDPQCTRFFMRITAAVDLVIHTIRTMKGGELVTPELPAYELGDLAAAMGMDMQVVGLPPWEKLHETIDGEASSRNARRMSIDELRAALR